MCFKKLGLFSGFQYGFKSSRSTEDLLTVLSHRIARTFNSFRATQTAALDVCKAFEKVSHDGVLHRLTSYGISGRLFGFVS